ncbi:MAG: hypothetical protein LUQ22_05510 [Methanotrichaceae archaeon]|nr:hypothetical protein [Methanotrichaceae archaeon]
MLFVNDEDYLGLVKDRNLLLLIPESEAGNVVRLTEMPMQAALPLEAQEIDLKKHESKAIMVRGRYGGGWIYSAEIIDLAGPILSALVQKVFSKDNA